MSTAPKVSVIMPSLNVAEYIRKCMDSVVNQTLHEIEIICVDAGSTDGTYEILQEYAGKDSRIHLIKSDKKSYGYQMNLGLDMAKGEYIGIVETDDFTLLDMFETLYREAIANQADMVKSNYYWYTTKPEVRRQPFENLKDRKYNTIFRPLEYLEMFVTTPAIWSGIYKRSMLTENQIRFNETQGASFQDTSFHFMVCAVSERCYLIDKYFLCYRRDNEGSSVNAKGKVFCICDEMHYFEQFLTEHPQIESVLKPYYMALKYEKYQWNYARVAPQYQWEFLYQFYDEFQKAQKEALLEENCFNETVWGDLQSLLENPIRYFRETCKVYSTHPNLSKVFPYEVLKRADVLNPKISVIIPVYNYENYIEETIRSVETQSLQELEIICVNDGSADKSLERILDCAQKDRRITVLSQINKGQSVARNAGITEARGQYIHFLDSDDLLELPALEELYETASSRNLDVLYFDGRAIYETPDLEYKHPYYSTAYEYSSDVPDVLTGSQLFVQMRGERKYRVSPCLAIYRREYILQKELRFFEGINHEDNIFTFACMLYADRVSHVKGKYLLRRVHAHSIMTAKPTFLHSYGYLTACLQIYEVIKTIPYDKELYGIMTAELESNVRLAQGCFGKLEDAEAILRRFNELERFYYKYVISKKTESDTKQPGMAKHGRGPAYIYGKIKGGIMCCRDHGCAYTMRYFFRKVRFKLLKK